MSRFRPERGPQAAIRASTQILKIRGEDAAADLLLKKGFRLLARNWRIRSGELDLVAMDGSTLVFVEVKARRSSEFTDPALGVDRRKQRQLRRLAEAFLALERPGCIACRFDVVSIVAGDPPLQIRHIPDAF